MTYEQDLLVLGQIIDGLSHDNRALRAVLSALCDAAATTVSGCVVLDRSAFESAVAAAVSVLQGEPE